MYSINLAFRCSDLHCVHSVQQWHQNDPSSAMV